MVENLSSGPPRKSLLFSEVATLATLLLFPWSLLLSFPSNGEMKFLLLEDDELALLYFGGILLPSAFLLVWCGVKYVVWVYTMCRRSTYCLPLNALFDNVFLTSASSRSRVRYHGG